MANIENQQPEYKYTEKSTLKNWFKSKLKPTQAQFWAWMDSYWHKGEKLPITTIDGLGEAVDGKAPIVHYHDQYATNDATSLSNENVEQWKKKLEVDNLQFDDQAISLTNEYADFGLTNDSKQAQFNQSIYNANQTKLNKPSYEGSTEEYPYLVGIDTEGYSANISIDQIGKVKTVNGEEPDENGNIKIEEEFVKNGTGWSLKYRKDNPSFYGTLGQNALDLSYTTSANTFELEKFSYGANGICSFTSGLRNSAMGNASVVLGMQNYSQGQTNHIIGYRSVIREDRGSANKGKYSNGIFAGEGHEITNSIYSVILGGNSSSIVGEANVNNKNYYNALNAILSGSQNKITSNANCSVILGGVQNVSQGINQLVSGSRNQAVTYGETLVGVYGTVQDTSLPPSDYVSNARMFNVGIGNWYGQNQDDFIRKDGLSVFWNGLVTAPTVNNIDIENNSKALTTKEFIEDKISNFHLPTNWTDPSQRFSGLVDKSADATYNQLLGVDANGNLAKVNGKNVLINQPNNLTNAERTAWKTAMNGGWTTATMSVARVTPFVITPDDRNTFINIEGANLNILKDQSTVSICKIDKSVVVIVPNEQVNYYTDGINLNFYYNFSTLPIGEYIIKISNGVADYFTTHRVIITSNIDYVVLGDSTYAEKRYNNITSANQYTNVQTIYYKVDANVKALADDGVTIYNAKLLDKDILSSENFYLRFRLGGNIGGTAKAYSMAKIGFTDSLSANNNDDFLFFVGMTGADGGAFRISLNGEDVISTFNNGQTDPIIEMQKQGNLVLIRLTGVGYGGAKYNISRNITINSTNPLRLSALFFNRGDANCYAIATLQEMYKF